MQENINNAQQSQKSEGEFLGVCFNPDSNTIIGNYNDQISAYRARKCWQEALRLHFNLENGSDFKITVHSQSEDIFNISCQFISATARYCFWKITNNQSPEVQYVIETAHIPMCEARYEEILKAPDLKSIYDLPLVTAPKKDLVENKKSPKSFSTILRKVLDQD
jgi:hypothetical protein